MSGEIDETTTCDGNGDGDGRQQWLLMGGSGTDSVSGGVAISGGGGTVNGDNGGAHVWKTREFGDDPVMVMVTVSSTRRKSVAKGWGDIVGHTYSVLAQTDSFGRTVSRKDRGTNLHQLSKSNQFPNSTNQVDNNKSRQLKWGCDGWSIC